MYVTYYYVPSMVVLVGFPVDDVDARRQKLFFGDS